MATQRESAITLNKLLIDSGLNEDCLIALCKYLDLNVLMNICSLDTSEINSFVPFMRRYTMKSRVFDFNQIQPYEQVWSINDMFEIFAPTMKKMKAVMTVRMFNNFLQKVISHCKHDLLTEFDFQVLYSGRSIQFDLGRMLEAQPFFRNLDKLTLCYNRDFTHKLTYEVPFEMVNIRELRLLGPAFYSGLDKFRHMLDRLPNLEVFVHTNGEMKIEVVANELVQRFPKLRGFGYRSAVDIVDANVLETIDDRYRFLEKFTHLTELHLSGIRSRNVYKVLRFVPNIKIFGISQMAFMHPPAEICRIVRAIKGIVEERRKRAGNSQNEFIHLQVNEFQFNELRVIKDVDKFIRVTVGDQYFLCTLTEYADLQGDMGI